MYKAAHLNERDENNLSEVLYTVIITSDMKWPAGS